MTMIHNPEPNLSRSPATERATRTSHPVEGRAKQRWTPAMMPSQEGRTAVVTGTGGLGLETAAALAHAGAEVIVAGRDPAKGEAALARIRREVPGAQATFERLDLASLASIVAFGARLRTATDRIDLLINNAAVMAPPTQRTTEDGFDLQFGTNHLGHVALTAQLLPLLQRAPAPRVVSLSSVAARGATMDLGDLQSQGAYVPMTAYGRSKLACLLFALELQRRSDEAGWGVTSIAAHPGISRTDLLPNGAGPRSVPGLMRRFLPFLFQPAAQGAWPTLFAATALEAQPGGYYGPDRLGETRGHPVPARLPESAKDKAIAARLWTLSEELVCLRLGEAP